MKTINQFLEELSPQLATTEYTERFKTELADHLEDAQYHLAFTGVDEDKANQRAFENVGRIKQLSDNFNKTMRYRNTYQVVFEALLNGLLTFPFVFIASTLGQIMFEAYHRFFLQNKYPEFYTIEIMDIPTALIALLALFTISLVAIVICNLQINQRLRLFIHEPKQKLLAALSVALPAALLLLPKVQYYIGWYNFDGMGGIRREQIWAGLLSAGVVLLVTGLAIYWSVLANKIKVPKSIKKFSRILQPILGIVTIIYLLLTVLLQDTTMSLLRHGVDMVLYIITFALPLGPYWLRLYLFGTTLILIALLCLYGIIQYFRKQSPVGSIFPWLKLTVVVYIVIFFSTAPTTTQNVQWHVPATNVSRQMEYHLAGPFSGIARYWQQLLSPTEIAFINRNFDHAQSNTTNYPIDNLADHSGYQIEYGDILWTIDGIDTTKHEPSYQIHKQYSYRHVPTTKQKVPATLSCIDSTGKLIDKIGINVNVCSVLYYHQSPIVQMNGTWNIYQLRLDAANHTALLQLSKRDGSYGDAIYLITLP